MYLLKTVLLPRMVLCLEQVITTTSFIKRQTTTYVIESLIWQQFYRECLAGGALYSLLHLINSAPTTPLCDTAELAVYALLREFSLGETVYLPSLKCTTEYFLIEVYWLFDSPILRVEFNPDKSERSKRVGDVRGCIFCFRVYCDPNKYITLTC